MSTRRKQKMTFRDAMDLVDDDLPDGAFWAMAHEIAGLDYGDGFDELAEEDLGVCKPEPKTIKCSHKGCNRKFRTAAAVSDHLRDKHHTKPSH